MNSPFLSLLVTEPVEGLSETITEIPLDARISTTHNHTAQATEFPVEEGAVITDHVHLKPTDLTIEGFISDSPITTIPLSMPRMKGDTSDESTNYSRSINAHDILMQVFRARAPMTVVTRFQTYEDMIITGLNIPESRDRSTGLWFTMNLKKITTIKTLLGVLPADVIAALKRRRKKTKKRQEENTQKSKNRKDIQKFLETGAQSTSPANADTSTATRTAVNNIYKSPSTKEPIKRASK